MNKIEIAIVEDNDEIRKNVCEFFNLIDGYSCHYSHRSFEDFIDKLDEKNLPDLIIFDIGLPGVSGIEGMKYMKEKWPKIETVVFTVYNDENKIFDSLCEGASGYFLKSTPLKEIKAGVDIIMQGGSVMSPSIARKITEHFQAAAKPKKMEELTPRENDVVQGLLDGLSYKLIADRLDISIDTVRFYIKSIYKKLYVNSRSEVIKKYMDKSNL
jgi:DNA-binding NarL/FixJ family response regulator